MVGSLGIVYLVVGIIGFIAPTPGGLLPSGYSSLDNVIHLVLGAANIAVGWVVGRDRLAAGVGGQRAA